MQKLKDLIKRFIPDSFLLKRSFLKIMGKPLNLKDPQTYNEKVNWLKLYDRNPLYTTLVDKYAVKKWVEDKIGKQYIIPTLGIWEKFDDIDFSQLPNQFVLKCTHDSGGVIICKDKSLFDISSAKEALTKSLKHNFYYQSQEWPYKNVPPRIIAEKYMEDQQDGELRDYKFYTFNGEPQILLLATNRQSKDKPLCFDYYDMNFNHLKWTNHWHPNNNEKNPHKPQNFEKMQKLIKVLAEKIPHVRVDFYEVNGSVYFGEMTFFPQGGFLKIHPDSWEKEWGDLLQLP